jgi:hypothetical protein
LCCFKFCLEIVYLKFFYVKIVQNRLFSNLTTTPFQRITYHTTNNNEVPKNHTIII